MKILVTAAEQQEMDRALKAYESVKDKVAGDVEFRADGMGDAVIDSQTDHVE